MNPLETLKDRLKVKPIVQYNQGVKVNIVPAIKEGQNIPNKEMKTFIIAEKDDGNRAKEILEKIKKKQLSAVIKKFPETPEVLLASNAPIIEDISKTKKTQIRPLKKSTILLEEQEVEENVLQGGPTYEHLQEQKEEQPQLQEIQEEEEEEEEELIITKPKKRVSKKATKGVIELGPEMMVQIGDTPLSRRLPALPVYNIAVSSYYMNNREIFVNFINGLFEPYRELLLDESKGISCEDIGKDSGEVSLLTHQKIVRDYMNLYTPYRGLLLYHGLGSGKTCSSIAIAEGMKSARKVIIMTPASLKRNYIEEIKKCGDLIYRKNQFWEWISIDDNQTLIDPLSGALGLPREYIRRNHGAWLTNITKESNYSQLSTSDKKTLNDQIDEMIGNKYTFINYNGLRRERFRQLTNNFENNIFDNAVVIIDEAHNLISRIVNKINKISKFSEKKRGPEAPIANALSLILYEFLLNAENSRIVLLTGTPIINYPNEIGILFNILRGYIKTWNFTLNSESEKKLSKETLHEIFSKEKILDYLDYIPSSKTLTITRNPYGFENKITASSGYKGVTNERKEKKDDTKSSMLYEERGNITDAEFIKKIVKILKKNDITAIEKGTTFTVNTALPDTLEEFMNIFIDKNTGNIINIDKFKRRIIGLTSYFRSAQEELLPVYDKNFDKHEVLIPMSDYQFKIYEEYRQDERKSEKPSKKKSAVVDKDGIFKEPSSTYRIFSRLACNFVMPTPPGRPNPSEYRIRDEAKKTEKEPNPIIVEEQEGENAITIVVEEKEKSKSKVSKKRIKNGGAYHNTIDETSDDDSDNDEIIDGGGKDDNENPLERFIDKIDEDQVLELDGYKDEDAILREADELEGDEILEKMGDAQYRDAIKYSMEYLWLHRKEYLEPEGLKTYSPKFLAMLENIEDEDHKGLHLIYSQFRSMEGIGIFALTLQANGFARFKIKKTGNDTWEINMSEEDMGKPCYALYTGTEDAEEREIIRNIYNGTWDYIPNNIAKQLRARSSNNNMGEIIKVLMITSAGSEGINLRNTRYVHIMEPYWHPVRTEQVIGRARRICSHQSLPKELQTVEVYIYIMTFTRKQLDSEFAIELKLKDLSKREPYVPQTTDEKLYEISTIKEQLSSQLLTGVKEASIDCATHIKSSTKEGLVCLSFGQPTVNDFSYNPNYSQDENDTVAGINRLLIDWEARPFTLQTTGKRYILRMDTKQVYDYDSVIQAKQIPGLRPILLGKLVKNSRGEYEIIKENI